MEKIDVLLLMMMMMMIRLQQKKGIACFDDLEPTYGFCNRLLSYGSGLKGYQTMNLCFKISSFKPAYGQLLQNNNHRSSNISDRPILQILKAYKYENEANSGASIKSYIICPLFIKNMKQFIFLKYERAPTGQKCVSHSALLSRLIQILVHNFLLSEY